MQIYEKCLSNLNDLNDWYSANKGDRNEATTRLHLINKLIYYCLNWETENVTAEDNYAGKYTDYVLKLTHSAVIIEAKKENTYFEVPAGFKKMEKCDIKVLCKDNKKIKEALKQVSGYCQERGIQIGVVTNGWQLILFMANRVDGIPPLNGKAYVFPSLDSMCEKFLDLWNFLSPDGIIENNLQNSLFGELISELPNKLSSKLSNYPGIKDRNVIQVNMQNLSEVILEDIIRDEALEKDFLKECYCKGGAISKYSLISKKILQSRYDFLTEKDSKGVIVQSATNKKGIGSNFKETLDDYMNKRPLLLVGDVGSGKTTFINNLIKVEAYNIFKKAISIKIDLGSKTILSNDIKESVYNEIINQLYNDYNIDINSDNFLRGVYYKDLKKFKNGIYKSYYDSENIDKINEVEIKFLEEKIKDKFSHLKALLFHIRKGRKQQIVIFIDNCDQRDYNAQQQAFLISHEFAEHWPVTVFVSLRPETFHKSTKDGALSGYNPRVFSISPPKVEEVLKKRLLFAQKIASGKIEVASLHSKLETKKLDSLLEVLRISLEKNKELLELIENISSGNIRKSIDLVKRFLGSGHVDTEKILSIYEDKKTYTIPIHEFLRAIIFGDNTYYDPKKSDIINLFDIFNKDPKEHFLASICLTILNLQISKGENHGFLKFTELYDHLQHMGYTVNQINSCLDKLYKYKLIDTSQRGAPIDFDNIPEMIRIKASGAYHLCVLLNKFVYFDAIIVDTPILNKTYREKISDETYIKERLERTRLFINYLDSSWKKVDKEKAIFDWESVSSIIKESLDDILKKVEIKSMIN